VVARLQCFMLHDAADAGVRPCGTPGAGALPFQQFAGRAGVYAAWRVPARSCGAGDFSCATTTAPTRPACDTLSGAIGLEHALQQRGAASRERHGLDAILHCLKVRPTSPRPHCNECRFRAQLRAFKALRPPDTQRAL